MSKAVYRQRLPALNAELGTRPSPVSSCDSYLNGYVSLTKHVLTYTSQVTFSSTSKYSRFVIQFSRLMQGTPIYAKFEKNTENTIASFPPYVDGWTLYEIETGLVHLTAV